MVGYKSLCVLLLTVTLQLAAQPNTRAVLRGFVMVDSVYMEGVHVLNLTANKSTISNFYGFYNIDAKQGDTLVLSALSIGIQRVVLQEKDFLGEVFALNFRPAITLLQEVEVTEYTSINAKSLGIIPENFKSYSPAGKELDAATSLKGRGGGVSLDPFLNWISGRTKMLNRNLAEERKYNDYLLVKALHRDEEIAEKYGIPNEEVGGFYYYLSDNQSFLGAMKAHNTQMKDFWMLELANRYKQMRVF